MDGLLYNPRILNPLLCLPSLRPRSQPRRLPYWSIICDSIHVSPEAVRLAYNSHPDGCVLVTDSMAAMGCEDGTELEVRFVEGEIREVKIETHDHQDFPWLASLIPPSLVTSLLP